MLLSPRCTTPPVGHPTDQPRHTDAHATPRHHGDDGGVSSGMTLMLCTLGIYLFYLLFGLVQEHLTLTKYDGEKFLFTSFLIVVQCIGNCIVAFSIMWWNGGRLRPAGHVVPYVVLAVVYVTAMFCSNKAIYYLDYPTQVLAKSCKPIPVLLMGLLFFPKRKYTFEKIAYVCVITAAVSVFMFEKVTGTEAKAAHQVATQSSTFGVILLAISLLCDGFTGQIQDYISDTYNESPYHMMFYINGISALLLGAMVVWSGECVAAVGFSVHHAAVVAPIALFSALSAAGQVCVYVTITRFGSLVCATITTTRKFTSVIVSVLCFGHQLTVVQWVAVIVVFGGLGLDMSRTSKSHQRARTPAPAPTPTPTPQRAPLTMHTPFLDDKKRIQ
eukprot:TRINITY_DN810_c0_g2_i6.p1 TRINITY_DN810_c0_g2~~TRINITY_DN810_c0_g2_i6.p1  ORF type:complete len:386 (-),score=83.19 TRINITY_DN810_c0_g2_i6:127-1284(-)